MIRALFRAGVAGMALSVLAACPPPIDDDDATEDPCDNSSNPTIVVGEVEDGQPVGFGVVVGAQVTDPDGISTVSLYYRTEGQPGFTFTFMSNDATGDESVYAAEIPASVVQDPGVDYYVRATDAVSGCQAEDFSPSDAPDSWLHFTTELDLSALPFYEFFEIDGDCDGEGADPDLVGWRSEVLGFPQVVHSWLLSHRSPLSGECSAAHSEGIPGGFWECPPPDGNGTIVRDNWLISPPLDFSGKEEIAARWFERHVTAGPCAEVHGLYVSTGSPDPRSEEYVAVEAALPFPGEAWASSGWYDLSEYSGQEQVYLAFNYVGGAAGRWQIDDFYVGEPLADLVLAEEPPPLDSSVGPGSENVELLVRVANISDEYGADALTATLTTSDPALSVTGGNSSLPALGPGDDDELDSPFLFSVGSEHADNAYLDFAMTLDDGGGHTWTVPIRLLMGSESTVSIAFGAAFGAELELELGYGSVEAPSYAVTARSADTPTPWTLGITEQADVLPPGPGSRRWYLRATNVGDAEGSVDSLVFEVGGVDYSADPSDLPRTLAAEEAFVIQIPPPPELVAESWTSDPDPPAPGTTVTLSDLTLRNDGSDTSGAVGCVMGSSAADATGFSTTPVTFGSGPIDAGDSRGADGDFSFDVDASHTDNSPIPLTLLCNDGVETLTHTFMFDIPYAHPVVGSLRIDDDDGDDDELADPGELVDVYVTALNDGAFATDGLLTASISEGTGSTAIFILSAPDPLEFGADPLESGESRESSNSFQVSVDPTTLLGDSIILDILWESGSDSWTETMVLEVTGLPWIDCPEGVDPQGDVLNGYDFDIKGCAYRSDGDMLQVRVDSWTPFVADVLFIDFFFYEVPNLYSIETVGGTPDFESGCVFGSGLPTSVPIFVELSGSSAIARIALPDIGEIGNNTQVAFGAGSCPDVYFCDTYPFGALNFNVAEGTYNCDGNDFIPINW